MNYQKILPMALFSAFFLKCLIFPFSYPEAVVLAALGAIACYFEYKNNDAKLVALETKLNDAVKSFHDKEDEIKKIRDTVNSLKLGAITRPMTNVR